jgi:uncharacterized radical SAM superfamily Fe-S cluster-containing enzyme
MGQQSRTVISPRELVINVTLRCPLKCAHCCFSSDMFQHGHLSLDDTLLAIRQAAQVSGIEIVHFVGGDPFLHADIMAEACALARELGLRCDDQRLLGQDRAPRAQGVGAASRRGAYRTHHFL